MSHFLTFLTTQTLHSLLMILLLNVSGFITRMLLVILLCVSYMSLCLGRLGNHFLRIIVLYCIIVVIIVLATLELKKGLGRSV